MEATIKCRKCPKLRIFEMASDYTREPLRIMAVCRAKNIPLNFEVNGELVDRPTKQDKLFSRIMPDSSYPKVEKERARGNILWADLRINPDGSIEHWIQGVNY